MKKLLKSSVLAVLLFSLSAFGPRKKDKEFRAGELQPNQTIHFGDKLKDPKTVRMQSYRRWSYDNSKFQITIDSIGNISVSNIDECTGNHQNELELINCFGSITRSTNDTVKIQASTTFRKFYLFNIKKNTLIDSFTDRVNIEIVSKTLTDAYCPVIVKGENGSSYITTEITALPKNIEFKEVYNQIHKEETVGIFSLCRVSDSLGHSNNFDPNDYVLIGGNSLNLVR
jgi:hypothetical protein